MKAIMVMFDTLNRRYLEPYGCDWTVTPNFKRLAERSAVFDNSYVGSMPCMPARRDLHTARYNFLHRSWGPLEPFDDSMPEMLSKAGVYTHLTTDHYHYFEDGGATYHDRYDSWEFNRGQENDGWKGEVADPPEPDILGRTTRHYEVNRKYMPTAAEHHQTRTFDQGCEFIRTNSGEDNWFLQIECFDPHEPWFIHDEFKKLYPDYDWDKLPRYDWPPYNAATDSPEEVEHARMYCAALTSMCDRSLGRILDMMDELNLWDDTMLILCTDHGWMMGEHDLWAKCHMPFYQEVAHTPLMIWDPRCKVAGQRRQSLVQLIDISATLLEFFNVPLTADMMGRPLAATIADDTPVREAAIFGIAGGQVNVTDGRYVYMRGPASPDNQPLFNHTQMATHMKKRFDVEELRGMQWHPGFSFTKGCPVMKVPFKRPPTSGSDQTLLWDIENDYRQQSPIRDGEIERRMIGLMTDLMKQADCPPDQYERLGLGVAVEA
jgi:arylsulfatase A-like enzyme